MADRHDAAKKIDVKYVAKLARLALSEQESKLFQGQLEKIVGYVNDIARVDVNGVEPLAASKKSRNVFRRDEPRSGLDRETVLKNAPVNDGQQFLVPKIV